MNLPSSRRDQCLGDLGERVMNNFSMLTADRMTHLKVVAVALVCATLVAGIGVAARVTDGSATADGRLEATVIKAGKPLTASTSEPRTIR
jgi:ABC-type proline/glycine betaine transport system permease subunit